MSKYAICTIDLQWTKDAELRALFTAVAPILKQQGVVLVRCWIAAIGTYRKVVSVWEAKDHASFLVAGAAAALDPFRGRIENLGRSRIDFATLLVDGPQKPGPEARRGGVVATGTVDVEAGMSGQFAEILTDSLPTMASHGVLLEASYWTQIGDRTRVLDVWWAPDANAVYNALSDPMLDAPAADLDYSSTMRGELVEVSTELSFT